MRCRALPRLLAVCALLGAAPALGARRVAPQQTSSGLSSFWPYAGDWLRLNGSSACLNHDLSFGPCGATSHWRVGSRGVRCGDMCLVRTGGKSLGLKPCAQSPRTLTLRDGRLCDGKRCDRCVGAPVRIANAWRVDRCGSIVRVARPTLTFFFFVAGILGVLAASGYALYSVTCPAPDASADDLARAEALVKALRAEAPTRATETAMLEHAIGRAAEGGYLHIDSYRTFALEQFHIVAADQKSMEVLALRTAGHAGNLFRSCAKAEAQALREVVALAAALGLDRGQLDAYEPMCAAHAYATFLGELARDADPAVVCGAFLLSFRSFGALCGRLSAGLRQHYSLPKDRTAFLDRFTDPAALDAFERAAMGVVAEGVGRGVPEAEVRRAAHMLQGYELSFWDSVYNACPELPEPVLRGTEGRFQVSDVPGLSLHYADAGARDGPVVVLLHGWPDSLHSWRLLSPHLDPRLRVISISLRGFGDSWLDAEDQASRSPHPLPDMSIATLAGDVQALLGRLGVSSAAVCGYSLGALVARQMAAGLAVGGAPRVQVTRLVLMASAPVGTKNHVAQKLMPLFQDPELVIDEQFVQVWQKRVMQNAEAVPDWFKSVVLRESLKVPKEVWRATLEAMAADDHLDALGNIKAKTVLLLGDQDRLHPTVDAQALAARIPDAKVRDVRNAGCVPHWDNPEAVAAEINELVLGRA